MDRVVRLVAVLAVAVALVAAFTGGAGAAKTTGFVRVKSYVSEEICSHTPTETACSYAPHGGATWNLLQVEGVGFSKNAPVKVSVRVGLTVSRWTTVTTDANGNFVWRSDSIEYCTSGAKLNVVVYDPLRMKESNMANFFTCTT